MTLKMENRLKALVRKIDGILLADEMRTAGNTCLDQDLSWDLQDSLETLRDDINKAIGVTV